jgi:hypothetical protein
VRRGRRCALVGAGGCHRHANGGEQDDRPESPAQSPGKRSGRSHCKMGIITGTVRRELTRLRDEARGGA